MLPKQHLLLNNDEAVSPCSVVKQRKKKMQVSLQILSRNANYMTMLLRNSTISN